MAKRVLLAMTYGALGIALTVALTLSAFALVGRNLGDTAGSASVRLVGEDVRAPHHPHHGHDRPPGGGHEHKSGQGQLTPPAPPVIVVGTPTGSGAGGGSSSHTGSDDGTGASGSGGADHENGDD